MRNLRVAVTVMVTVMEKEGVRMSMRMWVWVGHLAGVVVLVGEAVADVVILGSHVVPLVAAVQVVVAAFATRSHYSNGQDRYPQKTP